MTLTEEDREALVRRGFRPSPVTHAWIRDAGDGTGYALLHPALKDAQLTLTLVDYNRDGAGPKLNRQHVAHDLGLVAFLTWCSVEGLLP